MNWKRYGCKPEEMFGAACIAPVAPRVFLWEGHSCPDRLIRRLTQGSRQECRSHNIKRSLSLAITLLLVFAALSPTPLFASPSDDFKAANQLYDAGKFSDAVAAYEKLQPKTANLFFNLGNACFRDGQVGRAILNYERARQLSPRDPDVLANLKFAQQKLGVEELNAPPMAWKRLLRSVVFSRTPDEWGAGEVIGIWLAALSFGVGMWTRKAQTVMMVVAAMAVAWLLATASALGYQRFLERTAPKAVVLASVTEARFAPLSDSTVHFRATQGAKVSIREDRGGWLFVERADGRQGWIKSDGVERVGMK
jgi:tetratricopeptide (TPR) repeat protein